MTGLPSTGSTWEVVLEPNLDPLAVRYWQITDALIMDYRTAAGVPINWAASAVGLGIAGLFTPFAADGTVRQDLLLNSTPPNQGFYYAGELKEDTTAITSDITVQETPTAQSVRTVRDVITKLDDKVNFTMLESGPLADTLRYELPLANGIPDIGTAGYQLGRPVMDQLIERTIVLIGVDTDGNVRAEVFPRVVTNKKGKTDFSRKTPESFEYTGTALPDPFSQRVMWVCREGSNWRALGNAPVWSVTPPVATAVTGLKATIASAVPTGLDVGAVTYTATKTLSGVTTPVTLTGSPSISGGTVTVTTAASSLVLASAYTFNLIATGDNNAVSTSLGSNSVTAIT